MTYINNYIVEEIIDISVKLCIHKYIYCGGKSSQYMSNIEKGFRKLEEIES